MRCDLTPLNFRASFYKQMSKHEALTYASRTVISKKNVEFTKKKIAPSCHDSQQHTHCPQRGCKPSCADSTPKKEKEQEQKPAKKKNHIGTFLFRLYTMAVAQTARERQERESDCATQSRDNNSLDVITRPPPAACSLSDIGSTKVPRRFT